MSQVDDAEFQALVASKLQIERVAGYCAVAATSLLMYDYSVTLSDEVRCIWKRKFSFASALFYLNRYAMLSARILMIIQLLPFQYSNITQDGADRLCSGILRSSEVFTSLSQLAVAIFMALRIYAVWRHDWRIFIVVILLGLTVPASSIYYFSTLTTIAIPLPFTGCGEIGQLPDRDIFIFNICTRVVAILADAVVLLLTWMKTADIIRNRTRLGNEPSVMQMLLRDGTLYFVSLFFLNLANLVAIQYKIFGSDALPAFNDVITSVIVSRFFLKLRAVYSVPDHSSSLGGSFHASRFSDLYFASATRLGNIGAPLYSSLDADREAATSWDVESDDPDHGDVILSRDPLNEGLSRASSPYGSSQDWTKGSDSVVIYDDSKDSMYVIGVKEDWSTVNLNNV